MRLRSYPQQKPSGVPWLGAVPSHWEIARLRHVAGFAGGGTPSREVPEFWNGDVPWVSPKDMKAEEIELTEETITQLALDSSPTSMISPGSVLMVVRSGILKHTIPVAINSRAVTVNQDLKALSFDPAVCLPKFFLRWVQGLNDMLLLAWSKQGATVESIEHDLLADTRLPLPTLDEQRSIVAFLDRETAKIDALIAEQQKLIALLAEKRQATITHAVTRGLEPDVPMKDSGVSWLGQVPTKWRTTQLKYIAKPGTSITYGIVQAGPHVEGGIPYIKTSDMAGDSLTLEGMSRTTPEIDASYARSKVMSGDIVIAIRATVGKCLLVPSELEGANLTQGTAKVSPGPDVLPEFLLHFLRSTPAQMYFDGVSKGATFKEITLDALRRLPVAVPPLVEQLMIAAEIRERAEAFDQLVLDAQTSVVLLRERRSALITAAVTGQIDVRNAVPA